MNDIRTILCDSCCEPAIEYDADQTCLSALDGTTHICQSCAALVRIDVDYDYNEMRVRSYELAPSELSHVDFDLMVEAYEASQARITELYEEVSKLRRALKDKP